MNPTPPTDMNPSLHHRRVFQRFTDLEGLMIDFQTLGTESPTVILDAGFQRGAATWDKVASRVAAFASVLVLDRSLLLNSTPRSLAIDPEPAAGQIRQLLDHARLPGPIVPVGWTLGGIYALSLAADGPSDVVGLVLVDHVPRELLGELRNFTHAQTASEYCSPVLAASDGLVALFGPEVLDVPTPAIPSELPITHISRGHHPPMDDIVAQRWVQLQQRYLRNGLNVREVIAGRSGYAIPIDRPDVIIDAVRDLTRR